MFWVSKEHACHQVTRDHELSTLRYQGKKAHMPALHLRSKAGIRQILTGEQTLRGRNHTPPVCCVAENSPASHKICLPIKGWGQVQREHADPTSISTPSTDSQHSLFAILNTELSTATDEPRTWASGKIHLPAGDELVSLPTDSPWVLSMASLVGNKVRTASS